MTSVQIKGLLTFNEEFLGIRINTDAQMYDVEKELFNDQALQKAEQGNYTRIPLVEEGTILVSKEEHSKGIIIPLIDVRNELVVQAEEVLLGVAKPQPVVPAQPTQEPKQPEQPQAKAVEAIQPQAKQPEPQQKAPVKTETSSTKGEGDKPKAEPKKKTKVYTVLSSVKTVTPDGQGVEDREVKRDIEDTNLTNAKMKVREQLALEYSIPMKDVKVLKAGVKK